MSEHNSEESSISKYKNLDIEIETAINLANEATTTLSERLLSVYNIARDKGYDPYEARRIVEERIINVSPQYVRRILPQEAKEKQIHDRTKELDTRRQKQAKHVSLESPALKEFREEHGEIELGNFWVSFEIKIGTGSVVFDLLIDPNKKRVVESKRRR